jgi:V8-like Glu-specific endopeptidase
MEIRDNVFLGKHSPSGRRAALVIVLAAVASVFWADMVFGQDAADPAVNATSPARRVSDSPLLRLPEELRNAPPVVPPEPRVPEDIPADPLAMEIYDIVTGEVTVVPSGDLTQMPVIPNLKSVEGFEGLLESGLIPKTVFPPDDRIRITNTGTYPWRTICKLVFQFPDGNTYSGSGAVIGRSDGHGFHILTAGHCAHSAANGGWAVWMRVIPGYDDGYMPYYEAWATTLRSYTGWTDHQMIEHDWAVVTLDRRIGMHVGWMGRLTSADMSWYEGFFHCAGYPGDLCSGQCMYYDADYGCQADEHRHWYEMDTYHGQSGMPVYNLDGTSRYINTIHAYGEWDVTGCNSGTRLNQEKFDRIFTWTDADTPPTDYADLIDDGLQWAGFSPTTVTPGESFMSYCDVRNVGTASAGGFDVCFYASTNTTITTSDHLIGSVYLSSLSSFTWANADWSGSFPSIPVGTYYVGWIIDCGGTVTEFDEGNNVAYIDSPQLTVVCPVPADPSNCLASDGTYCDRVRVTWNDNSNNEDGFEIVRGTTSVGTVGAGVTAFNDQNAVPCITYSYRVRAYNGCGNSGYSNTNSGIRKGTPEEPTNCTASDGTYCDRVRVSWSDNSSGTCAESSFRVYRNNVLIGSPAANATYFDDTTASPCVTYTYKVRAYNTCGYSGYTNENTGYRKGVPTAPSNCQASYGAYCDYVRITWNDNSSGECAETGFDVYRDGSLLGFTGPNGTQFDDTTGEPCQIYTYHVVAENACGESSPSNSDTGARKGIPEAPSDCQASDGTFCDRVRITWTDNSTDPCAENGFEIVRNGIVVGLAPIGATQFDDTTADPCVTYTYAVRAQNNCGDSEDSDPDAGTRLGIPAAPTNCSATDADPNKIRLTWNDNASGVCSETNYAIVREGAHIATVGANVEYYDDTDVPECDVVYSYGVVAGNACGQSAICQDDGMMPCEADCTVDPTALTFNVGTIGAHQDKTFTITNSGTAPLSGTVTESCGEFTVTPDSYSLAPGAFETFTVRYRPGDCGNDVCTIETSLPCTDVSCTAAGPNTPICVVDPTELSFSCSPPGCTDMETFTITNDGCGILSGVISESCSEFEVSPGSYSLGPGNSETFYVTLTCEQPGSGMCTIGTGAICDDVDCTWTCEDVPCQDVPVGQGWNCVSSYIDPADPDMLVVWADVIAAGHLSIVKNDCTGEFCVPGVICNMDWDPYSCYMAHLSEPNLLSVCGSWIPEEGPVALEMGWNCVPFFPRIPLIPDLALAGCWADLSIVKSNCTGEFCIPGIICMIDYMEPGHCYMAHMAAACDLYYPTTPGPQSIMTRVETLQPSHFTSMTSTGDTYNVVVRDPEGTLARGDEIGVFSGDLCVGAGVWTADGILGLTVWGDDVSTEALDGCAAGDVLSFRVWDSGEAAEYEAVATFTMGDGTYGSDAYGMVDLGRSSTDVEAGIGSALVDELAQNFPNPFNPETVISYRLSAPTHVQLRIFNVHGEQVRVLVEQVEGAGEHSVGWDGRDDSGMEMSAGIYFYRLETEQIQTMKKMVLVK